MEELLKDLGLNDKEELAQFVEENPEHPIAQQITELLDKLEKHKEGSDNQI